MYTRNTIAKRRTPGWADRRRYYRHLFELSRPKELRGEDVQKSVPAAIEKD
jgi:hypothetical protein